MSNNQYACDWLSRTIRDLVDAAKSGSVVVFGTQALLIGNKCSEIPIGKRLVAVEECARDEPETGGQADNDKKDNGGAGVSGTSSRREIGAGQHGQ